MRPMSKPRLRRSIGHLELGGELLPAPARPRQAGPGRQLGHGAQLVPQFPNRASNNGSQRFHNHRGGLY